MRRKLTLSYRNSVLWITCENTSALLARVLAKFTRWSQVEEGYPPPTQESMDMTFHFTKPFHNDPESFHDGFTSQ